MSKKFISITALVMALVLCIPSVDVRAADITQFIIRAQSTVEADTSTDLGKVLNMTVFPDDELNNAGYIENMLDALSTFNFTWLTEYDYYLVTATNYSGDNWRIYIYNFNSENQPFIVSRNYNSRTQTVLYCSRGTNIGQYWNTVFTYNDTMWGGATWTQSLTVLSVMDNSGALNNYGYYNAGYVVLDANFPVYSYREAEQIKNDPNTGVTAWLTDGNFYALTDIFADTYGYDANGNIVSSSPDPTENMHLGFRKFDSQVIYNQTNKSYSSARVIWETDPISYGILENGDDWHMKFDISVSYAIQELPLGNSLVPVRTINGGFSVNTVWDFDGQDGNVDATNIENLKAGQAIIDPVTIFEQEHVAITNGDSNAAYFYIMLASMQGNLVQGNKAIDKWGNTGGSIINFCGNFVSTALGDTISGILNQFGISGADALSDFAHEHLNVDYYYAVANYEMTVTGRIVNDSEYGLYGTTYVDFPTHTTSSYAPSPTPEPSEEDPDPVPEEPYENTDDNPIVPSGTDGNGVVVYVPITIEGGGSGGGNASADNSLTFNPTNNVNISQDNGVSEMIDAVDNYPTVTNRHFWDYFLIFKDNDFLDATTEWWNALPDEVTDIIIASIGIISVFSIYRWIRRG